MRREDGGDASLRGWVQYRYHQPFIEQAKPKWATRRDHAGRLMKAPDIDKDEGARVGEGKRGARYMIVSTK